MLLLLLLLVYGGIKQKENVHKYKPTTVLSSVLQLIANKVHLLSICLPQTWPLSVHG